MNPASLVVDVLDEHSQPRFRTRVALTEGRTTFTVGRSTAADVIVDDECVAPLHARIEVTPNGEVRITDLDTVNGVRIDGKREHGVRDRLVPNGRLRVGRTALRIRTEHEVLAPERPDHERPIDALSDPRWIATAGALVTLGYVVYRVWLAAPRDLTTGAVTALVSALIAAGGWIAVWALLTRLLRSEWRWIRHAAILFGLGAGYVLVDGALDLGWFALSLPHWPWRELVLSVIALGLALYWHLTAASSLSRTRAAAIAVLLPAIGIGATQWVQARNTARNVNYIDIHQQIYPPAFRLRDGMPIADFFGRSAKLKAAADDKRRTMPRESDEEESLE